MIFQRFQTTNPAADQNTKPFRILQRHVNASVRHRHFGGGHGQLGKAIGPADILRVFKDGFWIEALHLSADAAIVSGGVKRRNGADAGDAVFQAVPEALHIISDGRDGA